MRLEADFPGKSDPSLGDEVVDSRLLIGVSVNLIILQNMQKRYYQGLSVNLHSAFCHVENSWILWFIIAKLRDTQNNNFWKELSLNGCLLY